MTIRNKVNISKRPKEANQRQEFGCFEANTIFSCNRSKNFDNITEEQIKRIKN